MPNEQFKPVYKKWYQEPIVVGFLICIFFPVGLYFMWKEKVYSQKTRIIVTYMVPVFLIIVLANSEEKSVTQKEGLPSGLYGTYHATTNYGDGRITINSDNTFIWAFSTGLCKGTYKIIHSEGSSKNDWYYGIKIKVLDGDKMVNGWEFYVNYANSNMKPVLKSWKYGKAHWEM